MNTTPKPGQGKEPEPKPGIEVDDHLYVHANGQPCTGRVVCHGQHGVTVAIGGQHHKVTWDKVLGHKRRVALSGDVVDQGEDGMIVQDAKGRRRYVAIPNEANEDPMVAKSHGQRPALLFMKAAGAPPGPGLTQKKLTDKNGVQTTRWISTGMKAPPAQRGQHIGFVNGEHKGHGRVIASGRDGVHVKDQAGGIHQAKHEQVTHHWEGEGAPDHSPHEQPTQESPNYEPRLEGENDKTYAKRAVDKMDAPQHLPEEHDRYFHTAGSTHVPLDRLHSTKSDEENQQGGDNGPKRMQAAYHGKLGKRDPIAVMPHKDKAGHYEVVDGNGTLTSAKKLGWKGLPTRVVSREDGERQIKADKTKELLKKPYFAPEDISDLPDPKKFRHTAFKNWEEAKAKAPEAREQFHAILRDLGKKLDIKEPSIRPDDMTDEMLTNDERYLFMGPLKTEEKSTKKVNSDYRGDWGGLKDLVRATVAVKDVQDVHNLLAGLKEAGVQMLQRPKDNMTSGTADGYRDINMIMQAPNGLPVELQVQVKGITKAKSEAHEFYNENIKIEQRHKAKAEGEKDTPFEQWPDKDRQEFANNRLAQQKIYGRAWGDVTGTPYVEPKAQEPDQAKPLQKSDYSNMIILLNRRKS